MNAIDCFMRQRWRPVQIAFAAIVSSLVTFATVALAIPPSPWNVSWMVGLPFVVGVALNRGLNRLLMASVLPVVSLSATAVIGTTMGGV